MDWCYYIDESGETFLIRFEYKNYSHYIDWPGRFYKIIGGVMCPVIFSSNIDNNWQDTLPDKLSTGG